jgi:hypothetical protein
LNLAGHTIQILEPEIVGQFVSELQIAIKRAGAKTLAVRDISVALERVQREAEA